jgi:hypothetical protein
MVGDGFVDALVAWSIDKLTKLTDWFCFVRITTATQNTAKIIPHSIHKLISESTSNGCGHVLHIDAYNFPFPSCD